MNSKMEAEEKVTESFLSRDRKEDASTQELLLFELDGELYAVPVGDIELVMKIPPVTAVPNAPASLVGIFHLRGSVVVVVDLLKRMGLPRMTSLVPYYVFIAEEQKNHFGVLVDRTRTVIRVLEKEIVPLDKMTSARIPKQYIKGTFIYQDRITRRSRSAMSNFMIEPISAIEKRLPEPVFTTRPVIILNLRTILDETDLNQSQEKRNLVVPPDSSSQLL